jgi:hypothetical protein
LIPARVTGGAQETGYTVRQVLDDGSLGVTFSGLFTSAVLSSGDDVWLVFGEGPEPRIMTASGGGGGTVVYSIAVTPILGFLS